MSNPFKSFESFSKRAAGRRRYNQHRQFQANLRLSKVIELLWETGPSTRGYQSIIARKLEVSRSTICRDLAKLMREYWEGPAAIERCRAAERLRRRPRAEDRWLEELIEVESGEGESEEPDAGEMESRFPQEPECREPAHSTRPVPPLVQDRPIQTPRWLPPSRSKRRSRTLPESRPRR